MFSQRFKSDTSRPGFLERGLAELAISDTANQNTHKSDDIIGPYGLNLLHTPSVPLVDLIFVHGVRGGSRKTWSKSKDLSSYWPKEWLPRDPAFKNARIFSFGYNSDWGDRKDSVLNIHDFGKSLLSEIMNSPDIMDGSETHLVFIGHSMGGLVIKQTHILASRDLSAKSISKRVYGIVFLATPHRGSDLAKVLGNMLKTSILHSQKPFVSDLERNSVMISLINDEFRHYSTGLRLLSFYETIETSLGLSSTLIVNKESATLGYPNEESVLLNATHRNICKFDTPSDPNYISLRNTLGCMVREITQRVVNSPWKHRRIDLLKIQTYLGVNEIPEDDLTTLEDSKLEGSCQWLLEKEGYLAWRDSRPEACPYYWLSGQQATGKSIMAAHVVRDLEARNAKCSYYFFKHNDKTKTSLSDCLRSLAYQMAVADLGPFHRLLDLANQQIRLDNDNESAVWRKIFVDGIFEVPLDRAHFWVIDGLDECNSQNNLAPFLSKVSIYFPLRVFITGQPTLEIVRDFGQLKDKIHIYQMITSDTRGDMKHYIQAQIESLPLEDVKLRHSIADTVLEMSCGCFLWVVLVLGEMRLAYSVADIENILKDIPVGMDALYERALRRISTTTRGKHVIKAILQWTVCAIRPLTLEELQHALQLELQEKVLMLKKFILSTCWQFVRIDRNGKVSLVHETVRAFLLREDLLSEFAINSKVSHGKLADLCLLYVGGNEMRPPRNQKLINLHRSKASKRGAIVSYASNHFSQHLRQSSSEDTFRLNCLCDFLTGNVLAWIEYIAQAGNLQPLIQTAKDMKAFLSARANYCSPTDERVQLVHSWESDLVHLVTLFGRNLIESPSSIFWLIPPFCPLMTAIRSKYIPNSSSISVVGLTSVVWSDKVSCIQYRDLQARAVAYSDTTFAVGLSDKSIKIYSHSTCQDLKEIINAQPVKCLKYSDSGKFLIVASIHFLTLYDLDSGRQLWQVALDHEFLEVTFAENDRNLWIITKDGNLSSLSVADGSKLSSIILSEPNDEISGRSLRRVFIIAAFSIELDMIAVAQRGRPVSLFEMNQGTFLGALQRDSEELEREDHALMWIRNFVFQPHSEDSLLAILYHNGQLVLFDPCELALRMVVQADAHVIACSYDGHTLATGGDTGTIQIFDFESLTLLYKIVASDYAIKSLAFSNNGLRFVDIRGNQCNVWEPSILVRETTSEQDSVSDTVTQNETVIRVTTMENEVEITALVCDSDGKFVFCGKDNGLVTLYSTEDGNEVKDLYSHAKGIAITFLTIGTTLDLVVSADASSRLIVQRLVKFGDSWSSEGPLLDVRVLDYTISQILLDSTNTRLLVSTIASDATYNIESGRQISSVMQKKSSWKWMAHPRDSQKLIHLASSSAHVHNWDDLSNTNFCAQIELAAEMSEEIFLKDVAVCSDGCKISVEFAKRDNQRSTSNVLIFPSSSFDAPFAKQIRPLALFENVSSEIEYIIGSIGSRLLFLDHRMWVCSLELEKFDSKYFRHFFIPEDWLSVNTTLNVKVTARGDFIFVKRDKIIVIKNGLENKVLT